MKTISLEKVKHNLVTAINVNTANTGGLLPSQEPTERSPQTVFREGEPWPVFSTVLVGIAGTLREAAEYHAHGALEQHVD